MKPGHPPATAGALAAALLAALSMVACDEAAVSGGGDPTLFDSPAAAAVAFSEAVRAGDLAGLRAMLGPESAPLLNSGDSVQAGNERKAFIEAYDGQKLLVPAGADAFILEVGGRRWPLPLPIVRSGEHWKFDTTRGIREIVLRRIGRNELAVIGVCKGLVAAQREYAEKFGGFASKLRSEPGKQDGLYWATQASEPESPAGPLLAWAEAQGYSPDAAGGQTAPYRGYFYRRLNVKDSKKEFAILAYPAEWGASGIMTFIVNQDGAIYRKDLGAATATAVEAMQEFAPDDTWTRET
jgi:hypothetical protein